MEERAMTEKPEQSATDDAVLEDIRRLIPADAWDKMDYRHLNAIRDAVLQGGEVETVADFKRAYELLFRENAELRRKIETLSETAKPSSLAEEYTRGRCDGFEAGMLRAEQICTDVERSLKLAGHKDQAFGAGDCVLNIRLKNAAPQGTSCGMGGVSPSPTPAGDAPSSALSAELERFPVTEQYAQTGVLVKDGGWQFERQDWVPAGKVRQLERKLAEAKEVQAHVVQMPDGSPVAAPCAISGCQYSALSATAATSLEVEAVIYRSDAQQAIELAFADVRRDGTAYVESTLRQIYDAICRRTNDIPSTSAPREVAASDRSGE